MANLGSAHAAYSPNRQPKVRSSFFTTSVSINSIYVLKANAHPRMLRINIEASRVVHVVAIFGDLVMKEYIRSTVCATGVFHGKSSLPMVIVHGWRW